MVRFEIVRVVAWDMNTCRKVLILRRKIDGGLLREVYPVGVLDSYGGKKEY